MDKSIPELIEIVTAQISTNMVVNGVAQTQEGVVLACPKCNHIIVQVGTVSYLRACEFCEQCNNELPNYCPSCGQALRYIREKIDPEKTDAKV